jgi:hypothetical protein
VSGPRHARDPRLDEGYRTSRAVGTVLVGWVAVLILLLGGIAFATVARAASHDPTPYTVTPAGITFPEPLASHGHVNVRLVDGSSYGLHLDPNNGHPGAAWIGATFLPWSALGITGGCVAWVQWSGADEHFGEGGQQPVCLDDETETPCPTATPSPEPTTSPTPSASPRVVPPPTGEPSTTPTVTPTTPTSADPTPSPSTPPVPTPTPTSTGPSASPSPEPTPTPTLGVPPVAPSPPAATSAPAPSSPAAPSAPSTTRTPELAATGVDPGVWFVLGWAAVFIGLITWGVSRKGGTR